MRLLPAPGLLRSRSVSCLIQAAALASRDGNGIGLHYSYGYIILYIYKDINSVGTFNKYVRITHHAMLAPRSKKVSKKTAVTRCSMIQSPPPDPKPPTGRQSHTGTRGDATSTLTHFVPRNTTLNCCNRPKHRDDKREEVCPKGAVKSPNCLSGPGLPRHRGQERQPSEAAVVPIPARIT